MEEGGNRPKWPPEGAAGCRLAGELLQASQYEQVAAILHTAQTNSAQAGDVVLAHMLDAARRVCVALLACHAEVERHRQAFQETERREQELRQELHAILDLLGKGEMPCALPGPEQLPRLAAPPTAPAERHGLWGRIRDLLRHRISPPPSFAQQAEVPPASAGPSAVPGPTPILAPEVVPPATSQGEGTVPRLVVYCLGPFRVYQDDQPAKEWPSSRGKSVFKYLIAHRERPVVKEVLMELFWPGMPPDAARNNLNVAIYGLRQALREARPTFSHVLFENDCYLLNPELFIWVDHEVFTRHVVAARSFEQRGESTLAMREYNAAEMLYQGEFMEEDRYEDWPMPRRQSLQRDYLDLLGRLSRHHLEQEDYTSCITACRKMLVVEPCYEGAHRRLMRCYSRQGQPYLALRQHDLFVEKLKEELAAPPSRETTTLYEQIRRGERV
jgi:DNA-binding SARP family transcriptional activator